MSTVIGMLLTAIIGLQIAIVILLGCNSMAIGRMEEWLDEEERKRK